MKTLANCPESATPPPALPPPWGRGGGGDFRSRAGEVRKGPSDLNRPRPGLGPRCAGLRYVSSPAVSLNMGISLRTNGEAVGTLPTGLATRVGWVPGVLCGSRAISGLIAL